MSSSHFRPGQSGNPAGRPKGARDRKNVVAAEFAKEGSAIARVVIEKAKDGDMGAAALVLQRLSPPLRPQAEKVTFDFDPALPVAEQGTAIVAAVARGEIDPDTGKMLLDMIAAHLGLRDVEAFLEELKRMRESKPHIPGGVVET
ncbi:MAG: DUF5681 domain-containing protein [Steroidobacteraceae bacterium]